MSRVTMFGIALSTFVLQAAVPAGAGGEDAEYGVYVGLVRGLEDSVVEVTETVEGALVEAGWEILAVHPVGRPDACTYEGRVIVAHSSGYAAALRPYGAHVAFAIPQRVLVFEDEAGVHVAAVDLRGLNRTIVDEQVPGPAWEPWFDRLASAVTGAFANSGEAWPFGQIRDEGRISRTFGIMAGGPFVEKIEVAAEVPASEGSVADVAARIEQAFNAVGDDEWALKGVYRLDLPESGAVVLGVSGEPMEEKAFSIVQHGGDDDRKEFACPGLDHAAAFPVELVVQQVEDRVEVHLIDEMFRMKMYFEDAGKVAFAKNMGMPGSIEDAIRARVRGALGL
ncbi:MAG: hypothetical protein HKN71_12545 [Gemmatimonadetes bacterium]|nr:hypothetical protein [Gemmatimonadota bacterium]